VIDAAPAAAGRPSSLGARAEELFQEQRDAVYRRADRIFPALMIVQWLFAIGVALVYSPYAWQGKVRAAHAHLAAAVVIGGLACCLPIALALVRPGGVITRHAVAVAQMTWSALLIHLMGGRIEAHFHVFGSLAFLAFYRDSRVLLTAMVVVTGDHFVRGLLWPESVYGVASPGRWRFAEHAFWVLFEGVVLMLACVRQVREMRAMAEQQAGVEALSAAERRMSDALMAALKEIQEKQDQLVRAEKLAAVGELAASVGHELRNPLAAIRSAAAYLRRHASNGAPRDPGRTPEFLAIIDREVGTCARFITDLLDFARERTLSLEPCPLRHLADEAAGLVQDHGGRIANLIPEDLPVPSLDRAQFRQVLVNLLQNAVEALPAESGGVRVEASGGGAASWRISVSDDGPGVPAEVAPRIFEPLFTTKTKGTGLGLAIVAGVVKRHGGRLELDRRPGPGTTFLVELPAEGAAPLVDEWASHRDDPTLGRSGPRGVS
jgi:two-component system sensor histidine kinase HydH